LAVADDRTLSLLDAREQNPVVQRSVPLPVWTRGIAHSAGQIIVSCSDRTIRIYDERKLKTAVFNSKPATKNGAQAVWSQDGIQIVCIGEDERITLVDRTQDVGQFKRPKYLAESPWVSAPCQIEGKFSLLTEEGVVHQFTDVVQFLQAHEGGEPEDDDKET
jgi:WD40 repeat protein